MTATVGQYNFGVYNAGFYDIGYDPNSFSFLPNFSWPLEVKTSTLIMEKEDGTEKRITKTAFPLSTYEVEFLAQTEAQKAQIIEFFELKKGSNTTFDYTDPVENITRAVRFEGSRIKFTKRADTLWDVTLRLLEVQ